MMTYISYWIFRSFNALIGIIPLSALYKISDFVSFLLGSVFKYRKEIIHRNLSRSFPQMEDLEKDRITKLFYTHLADLFVESIKGNSLSISKLSKHFDYPNIDYLNDLLDKYPKVILATAHYNNWEWAANSLPPHCTFDLVALYKKLRNPKINSYIKKVRSTAGFSMIPIQETNEIFSQNNENKILYAMVGDQSPSSIKKAIWVDFLGQETACLHGIEYYAKKYNYPIVYGTIRRLKRGHYMAEFEMLIEFPQQYDDNEITQIYMHKVESIIRQKPEEWLWSHRRWKHQKGSKKKRMD